MSEELKAEKIINKIVRKLEIYTVCGNWKKFFDEEIEYDDSFDGKDKWILYIETFNNKEFIGIILDMVKYEGYIEYKHNGIDIIKILDKDILIPLIDSMK